MKKWLLLLALVVVPAAWAGEPGTTQLEQAAGAAASEVAGKSVLVRCHDAASWSAITSERGVDPLADGFAQVAAGIAELAPRICTALDDIWPGTASACTRVVAYTETVRQMEWVNAKRRVRVRVAGKLVWRWRTVRVRRVIARTIERERVDPADCLPRSEHAIALRTLAHEAWHLAGVREEAIAECYGLQRVGGAAQRLGVSAEDARRIALAAWERYPLRVGTAYHSPDCRRDGPLDLTPGDGRWP